MKNIDYKTNIYTEKSWRKKYDDPLPLEAFGYPIWQPQDRRTKKQKQEDYFANVYDKLKTVQFKDKDEVSMTKFFMMQKLEDGYFGGSKNALAVYPVLCSRADFDDDTKCVRISRENIAKLAGIWTGAVDEGIATLIKISLVDRLRWQDGKRRGYEYVPEFFRYDINPEKFQEKHFPFHTCIINSGVWAELSRKAKALYIAMRSKAFFDQQAYKHIEGVWIPDYQTMEAEEWSQFDDIDKEEYLHRKWDLCNQTLKKLFQVAGIPYTDTRMLINELVNHGLVERVHDTKSVFKVFLRPNTLLKN